MFFCVGSNNIVTAKCADFIMRTVIFSGVATCRPYYCPKYECSPPALLKLQGVKYIVDDFSVRFILFNNNFIASHVDININNTLLKHLVNIIQ